MSCNKHDWYDDYKAYSRMNAGRSNLGSGDDWGCLLLMIEAASGILFMGAILYFLASLFGSI